MKIKQFFSAVYWGLLLGTPLSALMIIAYGGAARSLSGTLALIVWGSVCCFVGVCAHGHTTYQDQQHAMRIRRS